MDVDDIPDQFERLVDRARALLNREIEKARKVVDDLNAEKTVAAKALAELQAQITKAKAEHDAVLANLDRASSAVRLDDEIPKARTELERLKSEAAKQSKALEALVKQRTAAQAHVVALENDARQATAERCRAQEMMEQMRKQLGV